MRERKRERVREWVSEWVSEWVYVFVLRVRDVLFRYHWRKESQAVRERTKEEARIKWCEKFSHTERERERGLSCFGKSYPPSCTPYATTHSMRTRISPRYTRQERWFESIRPLSKRSRTRSRRRINVAEFWSEEHWTRTQNQTTDFSLFASVFCQIFRVLRTKLRELCRCCCCCYRGRTRPYTSSYVLTSIITARPRTVHPLSSYSL